jgi:hypothetical protein
MNPLRKPFRRRKGRFSYLLAVMIMQLLLSPWAEFSGARGRTGLLAMIEGLLGVMYLTVLLGRLVGLHVSQSITKASPKSTNGSETPERNDAWDADLG